MSCTAILDSGGTYEIRNEDNYATAPGNVDYPRAFVDAWHTIVPKEEENELCMELSQSLERSVTRLTNHPNDEIRKCAPDSVLPAGNDRSKHCCVHYGINHEARDFVLVVHLLDHLERHDKENDYPENDGFESDNSAHSKSKRCVSFYTSEQSHRELLYVYIRYTRI